MRVFPLLSAAVLSFCIVRPAEAAFLEHIARQRMTSRQVTRTAEYLRTLDRRELLRGERRQRLSDAPPSSTSVLLREPHVRLLRPAETDLGVVTRQRSFNSPTLSTDTKPSVISRTPVTVETEVFYRNGIKYFRGEGVGMDYPYAFMWLNFALADGHPLARGALVEVTSRMNPRELAEAKERTKVLAVRFLQFEDRRREIIRDRTREQDLQELLAAILRYRNSKDGAYPVPIPVGGDTAREICRLTAATCVYRADMRALVPDYLLRIPADPLSAVDGNGTGYFAFIDEEGKLTLFANLSEFSFIAVKEP